MQSAGLQSQTTAASQPRRRPRLGWRTLARRQPLGAISAVILCGLIATAVLAPLIAPYDPYRFNLHERGLPIRLHPPNAPFSLVPIPMAVMCSAV